jgi:CRISPR/Cas system-associated exonuclease Cas4 (RecB family)
VPNKIERIRRSHLEQYAGCPYSLYLQLVLGKVPPMGKHAQLGIIVHQIIDQMSEHDLTLVEARKKLIEEIEIWNTQVPEENKEYSTIDDELIGVGSICLDNFFMIKNEFHQPYESEKNIIFELEENLPKISCTLDRITTVNGNKHIHDWKTGKPMAGQKLITDLQPPLYIWAVFCEYGILPKTFTLHYLQHNKNLTYTLVDAENVIYEVQTSRTKYTLDVKKALEVTKKILSGIQNNQFNMPSDKTHLWRCSNFCWFGMTNQCAGSVNEQWKAAKRIRKEDKSDKI